MVTLMSVVMPSGSVRVTVTGSSSSPSARSGCRVTMFFSDLPTSRAVGSETSIFHLAALSESASLTFRSRFSGTLMPLSSI